MYCEKCGSEIEKDAKFCGNCGSPLHDNQRNNQYQNASNNMKPKKTGRSAYALVVFACVVILGLVIYFKPFSFAKLFGTNAEHEAFRETYAQIENEIDSIEDRYTDSEGYISEDKKDEAIEDVLAYAQSQLESGNIAYFEEGTDSVYMELPADIGYIYIPKITGSDNGAAEYSVATMQPCEKGYPDSVTEELTFVDAAAEKVEIFTGNVLFDNSGGNDDNYNDEEVELEALLNIADHRVIIWHGHGTCTDALGSVMVTGIEYSDEFWLEHIEDFYYKRFIISSSGHLMVTSEFFDFYITDNALDSAIIYLGTCSSGADNRLAQVLIDKGAYAVYANSGTIHTVYNLSMIKTVFDALCSAEQGDVITTSDALLIAKQQNGAFDSPPYETTKVLLYEDYENRNSAFVRHMYIPDDITNLKETNYFMGKTYSGYYTYDAGGDPIPFEITFDNQSYNDFEGTIFDDEGGEAKFYGSIDNYGGFFFNKSYTNPAILYSIQYNGTINLEQGLMSGTWTRSDGETGKFSINIE